MKRVISLMLALCMVAVCLCSCDMSTVIYSMEDEYGRSVSPDDGPNSGYIDIIIVQSVTKTSLSSNTDSAKVAMAKTPNFYASLTGTDVVSPAKIPLNVTYTDESFYRLDDEEDDYAYLYMLFRVEYKDFTFGTYEVTWDNLVVSYTDDLVSLEDKSMETSQKAMDKMGLAFPIMFKINHVKEPPETEEDPETEIELGNGKTVAVKYGNNTIVLDESLFKESLDEDDGENYKIDFSSAVVTVESVIIKNSVLNKIDKAGKNVEFITNNGSVVINDIKSKFDNSIVISLEKGNASHAQKKAMDGTVLTQVYFACKSNGKTLDTDAVISVPCDSETAKVYYVIDEHTIGQWTCEVKDGLCSFPRYKDGTYVICK